MKLLLSTSNILGSSSSIRRSSSSKSNAEFISSLRANFLDHIAPPESTGNDASSSNRPPLQSWTKNNNDVLEIPMLDFESTALQEEREQYDITAKLFFLPQLSTTERAQQIREAVGLVMKSLAVPSIDLLILSFPNVFFDEQEDCPNKLSTRGPAVADPEPFEEQLSTWQALEKLHQEGLIAKLGVAEFGHDRLQALVQQATIKPAVDQVNLRDCCSVPKDLLDLAKSSNVELLVHNDCSNILPQGTIRELLGDGPDGAGVLANSAQTGEKRKNPPSDTGTGEIRQPLAGDVQPQWVIKYTAVVKDRGVVESKGYFASAEFRES